MRFWQFLALLAVIGVVLFLWVMFRALNDIPT
jgi:hypothetical protein